MAPGRAFLCPEFGPDPGLFRQRPGIIAVRFCLGNQIVREAVARLLSHSFFILRKGFQGLVLPSDSGITAVVVLYPGAMDLDQTLCLDDDCQNDLSDRNAGLIV